MKKMICFLAILIISIQPFSSISAESINHWKAAFIRGDDLWIKTEGEEMRLTNSEIIKFPKWSFDGSWIAYIRLAKVDENAINEGDLWLFDVKANRHIKVFSNVNMNFQWAPNQNIIGFQSGQALLITDVKSLGESNNIASEIINFSWLPDGTGFLTSSKSGKSVFSDILLNKISLIDMNNYQPRHFYTIRVRKNDYFYGTSQFKWSHDLNWIAFQLTPTASLSADTNTLSVISRDGRLFRKIEEMLNYEEWFQWAPSKNLLGFIQGNNRISTLNKNLTVAKIPRITEFSYTPNGFVDRDLTWKSNNQIFVSRSAESDLVDVEQRPMPSIYHVDLKTKQQRKVTSPSLGEGDFNPISMSTSKELMWIRTNRVQASVMIANINGKDQRKWIENLDLGTWYYEHWNWEEVFSLYRP